MSSLPRLYVGLDYHVDSIRVCVLDEHGEERLNRSAMNDAEVVAGLVARFGDPEVVAIEACCGASDFADELHEQTGWSVKLADAGAVRAMKRGPDKTDRGDAFWLADLARVDHLPEVWLPDAATRQLRRLVRYRRQLAKERREAKQQLRGLLNEERVAGPTSPWTLAWREWLLSTEELGEEARWVARRQLERIDRIDADITAVELRLEQATAEDPVVIRLRGHKGVGLVTAAILRAEVGSFERFAHGKQLARFCGVTPCNRSSGRRTADAGLVKQANRDLRTAVIELAHRLARWDDRWREMKQQLVGRGKPRSVAAAAVANRWVRWLHHQMILPPSVAA
ncbi:MAG: IS110 family transposase [Planctomycetota bacterium]